MTKIKTCYYKCDQVLGHESRGYVHDAGSWLGGLVEGGEHSAPVSEGVEGRPVPHRLPRLPLQLNGRADFLEFSSDVKDAEHCEKEGEGGLDDDVDGKEHVLHVGVPRYLSPLRC